MLGFNNVTRQQFFRCLSEVFWLNREAVEPKAFAIAMRRVPYETWYPHARFFAVPTPTPAWGWKYVTLSARELIWLPGDIVLTRGLEESENFRAFLQERWGQAADIEPPAWLAAAEMLAVELPRPYVSEYGLKPTTPPARSFYAALKTQPLAYLRRRVKSPAGLEARVKAFYVSTLGTPDPPPSARSLWREAELAAARERWNALQELQAAA